MKTGRENIIIVNTVLPLSMERVWEFWTKPEHIANWNFASKEWYCPSAENDLKPGGKFKWRMEAKDGSMSFDYSGVYQEIKPKEKISKKLDDGRLVEIIFSESENGVEITESFEAENQIPIEMQRQGWQAILNNFKQYALTFKKENPDQ